MSDSASARQVVTMVRANAPWIVRLVLIGFGALALVVATDRDRVWWMLVWFLLGMTCLSLLLLMVSDAVAARMRTNPVKWWPWASIVVTASGLAVVALAVVLQLPPVLAIAGSVLFTVGVIGLYEWFGRPRSGSVVAFADGTDGTVGAPGLIGVGSLTWVGFEAMAVGIGLLMISNGTASLLGAFTWIMGLIATKIGSLQFLQTRGPALGRTVRILADIALLGLFGFLAGAFTSNLLLLLLGLSVLTPALSMIGVGALQLECSQQKIRWVTGLSLVAMFAVIGWTAVVTQNPGLAFVLGLILAIAGSFFVFRGEGIVILMLVGYVIGWGLVDRSVQAPALPDEPVRIVALGDSFISGEGAREFHAGTDEAGGNQCRRAPTSYPYLVAQALDASVVSYACSGAKIADLTTCGQMWPGGRRCRASDIPAPNDDADTTIVDELSVWGDVTNQPPSQAGPLPQLVTAATQGVADDADVVLVSIGGNDVGFSAIVKACLLPKGCDERREVWLNSIDLLGPQLDAAYADVAATFPQARVLVVPYPMLVNAEPRSCDLGLSSDERAFVVDFIQKLDSTIAAAAGRAGFVFVEEAIGSYDGSQLCDEPAAANHLRLAPPAGDSLARYSPARWVNGSMHPNELGHELTAVSMVCRVADGLGAASVEGAIEDRPFDCPSGPAAGPGDAGDEDGDTPTEEETDPDCGEVSADTDPTTEAACAAVADIERRIDELTTEVGVVTEDLVSDDEWIRIELFRTVRALALPLVLLLVIGIVFAWGFAQLDNPFSRFLHQDHGRADHGRRTG